MGAVERAAVVTVVAGLVGERALEARAKVMVVADLEEVRLEVVLSVVAQEAVVKEGAVRAVVLVATKVAAWKAVVPAAAVRLELEEMEAVEKEVA
eukprot:379702-Prymnesium_polylepis.1